MAKEKEMEFIIASDVSGGYMALPDGNGEGRWVAASLAELAAVAPVIYWDEVGQAIKLDGNGEEAVRYGGHDFTAEEADDAVQRLAAIITAAQKSQSRPRPTPWSSHTPSTS